MGIFSRFERTMEDGLEGAADKMFDAPISPVQISKKAERAMRREKMVGAGREYAPTLYTVLVNPKDDQRLFGYYPTLAGETETFLAAKAVENGLIMDGQPLVRFIVDNDLRHGKFDIIAEMVSAPIVEQLRVEEYRRYGIGNANASDYLQRRQAPARQQANAQAAPAQEAPRTPVPVPPRTPAPQPVYEPQELPYVPEEDIDRSIDYGEYTFNSQDFQDGRYTQEATREARDFNLDEEGNVIYSGPAVLTNTRTGDHYNLDMSIMGIGRGTNNDIVVDDANASRKHAELRYEADGSWSLVDLNSTNGTKVNGRLVGSASLKPNDRITIGTTDFVFSYE